MLAISVGERHEICKEIRGDLLPISGVVLVVLTCGWLVSSQGLWVLVACVVVRVVRVPC